MKNKLKTIAVFIIAIILLFPMLNLILNTTAAELDIPDIDRAGAVYLYNIENDMVIYEKNTNSIIFPASTVKIMTGYIAVSQLKDRLDEKVTITDAMLEGASGNCMKLVKNEVISINDLLYGVICGGYNDAAIAIAFCISGSVENFIALMNETAENLNMQNTVYKNPTGMHDYEMVTTLSDTIIISKAAMSEPIFMEISSAVEYTVPANNKSFERTIYNRNELIATNYTKKYYNENAQGLNAGSTTEGGYCVVTTTSQNSLTYLCIVMNADEDILNDTVYSYAVANHLIDMALSDYGYVEIIKANEVLSKIAVGLSLDIKEINLITSESKTVYMDKTYAAEDINYRIYLDKSIVNAPVSAGDVLGRVTVYYEGKIITTSPLVAETDVKPNVFLITLNAVKNFIKSSFFIIFITSFCLLSTTYFLFCKPKKKSKNYTRKYYK